MFGNLSIHFAKVNKFWRQSVSASNWVGPGGAIKFEPGLSEPSFATAINGQSPASNPETVAKLDELLISTGLMFDWIERNSFGAKKANKQVVVVYCRFMENYR